MSHPLPSNASGWFPTGRNPRAAWGSVLVTTALLGLIELLDRTILSIPVPISILIIAAVYAALVGGTRFGLISAGLIAMYGLCKFSTAGRPFTYTYDNVWRAGAALIIPTLLVLVIGFMRKRGERAGVALREKAVLEAQLAERRKIEQELRRQRSEQQTIFHSVPAMIWFKDEHNRILRVNYHAAKSLGKTVEEVEGRTAEELYPYDAGKYLQDDLDVTATGKPKLGVVERYEVAGGKDLWIRTDKVPYRDENGNIVGLIVFAVDVTEQYVAQRELQAARDQLEHRVGERTAELLETNEKLRREIAERERAEELRSISEHRLQQIIDNSTAVIYAKDVEGRYWLVNRQFEEIFVLPRDRIIGRTDAEVFPVRVAEAFRANDQLVLDAGKPIEFEEVAPHHDGPHHYISLKFPLLDASGRSVALCGISTDITERTRTQNLLKRSERQLADLFENAAIGIHLVDGDGYILRVNRAELDFLGYSRDDYVNHHIAEFHADKDVIAAVLEHLRRGETLRSYEARMIHSDGSFRDVLIDSNVLWEGDQFIHTRCFTSDVTDRKRHEKELRDYAAALETANRELAGAREAAESANRAKGRFLANISHEIRTPIMAMLGAAELLGNTDPTPDRQDMILRNGRHLLALIDELLDVSRIEAGKLTIALSDCSILEILADVNAVTEPLRLNRPIEYRVFFDSPVPAIIRTDCTRLIQAIINLVNNALKFTEEGHVHVRVRIDRDAPEPRLTIVVEDTGIGIRSEDRERIFETFAQVDGVPHGPSAGAGLGLPIARWIAERLGGELTVGSGDGRGSRFTLRVATGDLSGATWTDPERLELRPAPERKASPLVRRLSGRVLVAEDAEDTRELVRFALASAGAEVVSAANGREAVELARAQPFDLILLDIRMPELDGLAAARDIRARGFRGAMIALTASTSGRERERVLAAGFDDVWPKPISLSELVERTSDYLAADTRACTSRGTLRLMHSVDHASPAWDSAVAHFAASLPNRMRSLQDARQQRDHTRLHDILHQLVGSAGIHGFMDVSDEAARLLAELKGTAMGGNGPELTNLRTLVDRAVIASPALNT